MIWAKKNRRNVLYREYTIAILMIVRETLVGEELVRRTLRQGENEG